MTKLKQMELLPIVYRNLRVRPVRSFLTLLGIIVATASMVLFLSFGEGLRQALSSELSRIGPSIQVVPGGSQSFGPGAPEVPTEVVNKLRANMGELGLKDVIPSAYLVRGGFDLQNSFFFQGLPQGVGIGRVYPDVKAASGTTAFNKDQAVIGAKVASRNQLIMGSKLRLSPTLSLTVTGILKESGTLADNVIFVPNQVLQQAMGTKNYNVVLLELRSGESAEAVSKKVDALLPGYKAQTTSDVMQFANRALRISDLIRFGISLVALIVGGLLVANTVMMSVYERIREFGVMRAIGARRGFIFGLVLYEALALALSGGVIGVFVGWLISTVINIYTIRAIAIPLSAVTPRLALFALLVALTLGLVAGLLPARTASRVPVVEALGRI